MPAHASTSAANATSLVFTHYLDAAPDVVHADLQRAVDAAAAGTPTAAAGRSRPTVECIDGGVRIAGVGELDGSEILVQGTRRLTAVVVRVPWGAADARSHKALTASRFADTVAGEVELAA